MKVDETPATKQDISASEAVLRSEIKETEVALRTDMQKMKTELRSDMQVMDMRLFKLETDMVEVKQDVAETKGMSRQILDTLDDFLVRLDRNETEQAARDLQFTRLVGWGRKVGAKTGVPLTDL